MPISHDLLMRVFAVLSRRVRERQENEDMTDELDCDRSCFDTDLET
jgi:hypothetical protein